MVNFFLCPFAVSDFFFVPRSCHVDYFIFITDNTELKIHHHLFIYLSFISPHSWGLLTLLFLTALCAWCVSCRNSVNGLLPMSSRSSVDRAPARCLGGHGFDSHFRDSDFFFVPGSCHIDYFMLFYICALIFRYCFKHSGFMSRKSR